LGAIASRALTRDTRPVEQARQRPAQSPDLDDVEVRVTYHPAGVLRNPSLGRAFNDDVGWLVELEPGTFDRGCAARVRDLVEQGYSTYEIGRMLGVNEPRIRKILRDNPPPVTDGG
jgi:hypothetical protein